LLVSIVITVVYPAAAVAVVSGRRQVWLWALWLVWTVALVLAAQAMGPFADPCQRGDGREACTTRRTLQEWKLWVSFAALCLLPLTFAISRITRRVATPLRSFAWACVVGLILSLIPSALLFAVCKIEGCH
jgi:hypothetical protein